MGEGERSGGEVWAGSEEWVMLSRGRRWSAFQCRRCGRGHVGVVREGVLSGVGPGGAGAATGARHGRCCRWPPVSWAGSATNGGAEEAGGRPRSGRACGHGWSICWTARKTWTTGRTRRLRMRLMCWSNLRMPRKMQSKAVGRRGIRRFAIAATGAACRKTPL